MEPEELIKLLVFFSKADDHFDDQEFLYILNVGERIGLPQDYIEDTIRSAEDPVFKAPPDEQERMRIFYYLLFLIKADKQLDDAELKLLQHFGFRLGFSRAMVNDFVDLITHYKDYEVPTQAMIDIIRKYQN